jgi:signal transduction histidine kinase
MVLSLIDRFTKTFSSIPSTFRCVEWILLPGSALITWNNPVGEHHPGPLILIFCALAGLSFIFPIDRPLWQRRSYIAIAILLVLLAQSMRGDFGLLLCFTLVKSCVLLSRRDIVIGAIAAWIGCLIPLIWLIPQNIESSRQLLCDRIDYHQLTNFLWSNAIIDHSISIMFVLFVGFLVVREHRNQQQIIVLNEEVETLATIIDRTRIARNIHDTLGHTLTALGIQIEIAQQICRSQPENTVQRLNTAKQLTDQCLEEIRNVVQSLRQSDFDLTQGLTGMMTHLQQTNGLSTDIQLDLPRLPMQTRYQIYCMIQEGITNIQKHADASHVTLRTELDPATIVIELQDDGQGFDLAQTTSGFGLQGMQERLQLVGGRLQIQTTIGQGTLLRLSIPHTAT